MALDRVGIERNEQIVTGFTQFLNGHTEWTTNNTILVVVLNTHTHHHSTAMNIARYITNMLAKISVCLLPHVSGNDNV